MAARHALSTILPLRHHDLLVSMVSSYLFFARTRTCTSLQMRKIRFHLPTEGRKSGWYRPPFQLSFGLIIIIGSVAAQYRFLPFTNPQMNIIDCVSLLSITHYLITGFILISAEVSQTVEDVLVWLLIATTTITMVLGCYYVYCNFRTTTEADRSKTQLVNHTVGAWWKVTLGIREQINVSQFYSMIGGMDTENVSVSSLIEILDRAQVRDVVGDGMAHLLRLLLDGDGDGDVSADELWGHLWNIPSIQNQVDRPTPPSAYPAVLAQCLEGLRRMVSRSQC